MRVEERQNEGKAREDQDSSSSSGAYYQGTLNCSGNDGFPCYIFATDDNMKVFITTKVLKVESFCDKGADYIYTFYLGAKEPYVLGEMIVSTSFELCPHGIESRETKFVLCVKDYNIEGFLNTLNHTREKDKGLSNVVNIFKDQRASTIQENGRHLSSPKLELAAIIMKDHTHETLQEEEIGGWGLKFLKKQKQCESCKPNACMNVVLPAGFHGGPRIRNGGGPSSLVERWRSGGSCDCGGWDVGCPLTVLYAKPNHEADVFRKSVVYEFFVEGCKQNVPVLKMVEVCDGLYDIRYKPILSPLQCVSIALAAIHSRRLILRRIPYTD